MGRYNYLLPGLALVLASSQVAFAQADSPEEAKNKQLVLDWWREVVTFNHVELANKYMADDYIEHNPNYAGGRKEFVAYFGKMPAKPIQPKLPKQPDRAMAKGDYVVLVWELDGEEKTGKAFKYNTFDIVRVQNGKIAEHWDGAPKNP
ncbi:MAG TPA: nuclear transport factor 2 family protein [Bryobacteraceae bacterium]|nr:nuclear transport factor 2 family protein [Bryobacteraceae bacterium]